MTDLFDTAAPATWRRAIDCHREPCDSAIQRGKQIIAKCYLDGGTLYVLWNGNERVGHYECAEDAKEFADTLESN